MAIVDLIERKRLGGRLSRAELDELVGGYVRGVVPDYQVAAWLMAICWRGMEPDELGDLTSVMAESGRQLDLGRIGRPIVDKHSTGGVADTTSLVVVPLVAACGVAVAKMSGRGLGFSGGTLDKLESLPGLRVDLSAEEFVAQVRSVGAVIAGQSPDLAPADGKLYALRDVTATVPSVPLIASSVMSKKLAGGAPAIVLDVKAGRGAFMSDEREARELAEAMIQIGRATGRKVTAYVTDMSQPLGSRVGNALELLEAREVLTGSGGSPRLVELALELATEMLVFAGAETDRAAATRRVRAALEDGSAYESLKAIVTGQGGDVTPLDEPARLQTARIRREVSAPRDGHVAAIDPLAIARAANQMGAGRERKGDSIDHAVGIQILHPVGSRVSEGTPLAVIHANDPDRLAAAEQLVAAAFEVREQLPPPPPLVYARLSTEP